MRRWTLSLAVLALVVAPVLAGKYNKVVSVGDKAPAIAALPAVYGEKDTILNLADVKEDVVVVAFLAGHCEFTWAVEDRLYDLVESYKGKSVKVVGVNCSGAEKAEEDGIPGIKKRIKEGKYNIEYASDPSGRTAKAFGATVTPEFFVLDKDRKIRYTGLLDDSPREESKVTKTYLKTAIDNVLANKAVEVVETKAVGCGLLSKLYKP